MPLQQLGFFGNLWRFYLGNVLAVNADAAPLRVVESEEQTQDGALP